jgi:lipopolysaccharide/colanic/teichoic acid biosynthesis glycosyltransferase
MSDYPFRHAPAALTFDGEAALRRAFDVVCAFVGLIILAPAMLVIVAAIWVESGRPIFFSQLRLGRLGRPFAMYKFRKFRANCGPDGAPLTTDADARFTRTGRILAATKLDELPQLWNILIGQMSVVGPRPESLAFADCFKNGFERVLEHTPGLLGPSQAVFRNESSLYPAGADTVAFYRSVLFPAKARIDLEYFANRSFFADLRWVFRTAGAVFGIGAALAQSLPAIAPRSALE